VPPTSNSDGTPLTNLAGYHIYYGTSATVLGTLLNVAPASTTSAQIQGLKKGTYYFAVTAQTADGVESEMSAVVSKTVT
jgi:hypothetical protein